MSKALKLVFIFIVVSVVAMLPVNVSAALLVSVSPVSQTAPQATQASYTVSYSGGLLGATYVYSVSGLPYGTTYNFSPSLTSGISGSSTLVISTGDIPGAYCPGSYFFTVSVTNQGAPSDTGSASGSLSVAFVGPPLVISVSSDKPAYIEGDTITLQVTVSRPAEGTVTISAPSGAPSSFSFQTLRARTVTKRFTAAQPYGTYTVTVNADDYCNTRTAASFTYSVGPSTYSISIQLSGVPLQYSATLQVDGKNQGTIPGSQTTPLSFPIGTIHTVTVDQYVSGPTGVRYYCPQNTMSVSSSGSYSFSYQTQYELTIATSPSRIAQVGNSGWFNAGASAQTGQAPQIVAGPAGTQYAFGSWVLDGAAQSGKQIMVTMNGPHNATANYTTQYLLTVNSPSGTGNPQGGGYYNAGSTAQFSVTSPEGYLIQQVFVQWQGDYTGSSPTGSVTMNGPKTVNAVWTTSYLPLIAIIVVAAAIVGGLLFWRSRRTPPTETKPTPSSSTQTKEGGALAAQVMKCQNCGSENSVSQKFCTTCGEKLTNQGKH